MARMYSRKRGKSGSTKPSKKIVPTWIRYKPNEVEHLVIKLAKEGQSTSLIGLHLRDTYGIPDVKTITKKSISDILEEKKISPKIPEDMMALIKRSVQIRKHLEENHLDQSAKRGLQITESKIGKLAKYYKKNNRIPQDWKYDPNKVSLLVE